MKKVYLLLGLVLVIGATSCKKNSTTPTTTTSSAGDIASKVIGDYEGSGEDSLANPFVLKTMKVTKVNDTRNEQPRPKGTGYLVLK